MEEVSGSGGLIVGYPEASILTVSMVTEGAVHYRPLQSHCVATRSTVIKLIDPALDVQSTKVVVTFSVSDMSDVKWSGYCVVSMVSV